MVFWVYENWVAEKKAVIHVADCRFCNSGAGTGRNTRGTRNGRWHGPFDTFGDASSAAHGTRRPVRSCGCVSSQSTLTSIVPVAVALPSSAESPRPVLKELAEIGFHQAGAWIADANTKGGVRCQLHAFRNDRVVYAFVVRDCVAYIGICDSYATGLADRMSRYQNLVGAGTNARVVGLIGNELSKGDPVQIYALKPPAGPQHLSLDVDYIKGFEAPLIKRFAPLWNKRR